MGDSKRQKTETETKMEMEKVEKIDKVEKKEASGSVNFAELRDDLFREAAKLVSEDPSTKIAIFVTPPPSSSESDVSMFSFGFPSVNGVVNTFLENNPAPVDDAEEEDEDEEDAEVEHPRFWWEDTKQFESMNPEQLNAACQRMLRLKERLNLELDAMLKAELLEIKRILTTTKLLTPKPKGALMHFHVLSFSLIVLISISMILPQMSQDWLI